LPDERRIRQIVKIRERRWESFLSRFRHVAMSMYWNIAAFSFGDTATLP
jgi:hypothetical protein